MDARNIKLVSFDLDGTLTQHKSGLGPENKAVLDALARKYKLLMIGAGSCARIFEQMGRYPIDIIGNYGMQYAEYDADTGSQCVVFDHKVPVDRPEILRRAALLRERFSLGHYQGGSMEFHPSGALTFPVLGTGAALQDKLAYDPERQKRRLMYPYIKELFADYTTFIGGSSSFDFAPAPFCKLYALDRYCAEHGYTHDQAVYAGDDYGPGGNDADICGSDFRFIRVDDYSRLAEYIGWLL
jgi:hydroxymethylpyrimidine pyrophosphatase-like HAD family hydrolase